MKVLNKKQIEQKIARIAMQILEENYKEKILILAGLNNNGAHFADLLITELRRVGKPEIIGTTVKLNPARPLTDPVSIGLPEEELRNRVIILVDDVANTGRTLFYACHPLMRVLPKKVQVAVLVDRKHKSYPIAADFVGLSLATTFSDDVVVDLERMEVTLR